MRRTKVNCLEGNSQLGHGDSLQGDESDAQRVLGYFLHLCPHFLQQVLLLGTEEFDGINLRKTSKQVVKTKVRCPFSTSFDRQRQNSRLVSLTFRGQQLQQM